MNYQTKATPITTEAEFDAARAAGARIEYTVFGPGNDTPWVDHYDMPPHDCDESGGWILDPAEQWTPLKSWHLMRAFYPVASNEEPEA